GGRVLGGRGGGGWSGGGVGVTSQLETCAAVGAATQAPPEQICPALQSESLPQAGAMQVPSSQTWPGLQSLELRQTATLGATAGGTPAANSKAGIAAQRRGGRERIWCFHGVVAFIMLLRDLPAKVAEDFAAMEAAIGGSLGVLQFEARRVLPRRVTVNKLNYYKIAIVGFEGTIRLC